MDYDLVSVPQRGCFFAFALLRNINMNPLDIAAAGSLWADILAARGIRAYRLDRSYPQGIEGRNIGGDAGDTGLPDSFARGLSLQCSFECFEGEGDISFVKEAARILSPDSRLSIVPLYIDVMHFVTVGALSGRC